MEPTEGLLVSRENHLDPYQPVLSGQRIRGAEFVPLSLKPGLKKGRRGPAKAHSEKV